MSSCKLVFSCDSEDELAKATLGVCRRGTKGEVEIPFELGQIAVGRLFAQEFIELVHPDGSLNKAFMNDLRAVFEAWKIKNCKGYFSGHGTTISKQHFFKEIGEWQFNST